MVNPFASSTELLVLQLLNSSTGMYGLELVRESGDKLKRGTVYVVLGRLQERGLVRSKAEKNATHPGLPRPRYSLTQDGRRMLDAWTMLNRNSKKAEK